MDDCLAAVWRERVSQRVGIPPVALDIAAMTRMGPWGFWDAPILPLADQLCANFYFRRRLRLQAMCCKFNIQLLLGGLSVSACALPSGECEVVAHCLSGGDGLETQAYANCKEPLRIFRRCQTARAARVLWWERSK